MIRGGATMKKRLIAVALALCVCVSSQSVTHAWQEDSLRQENVGTENNAAEPDTRDSTILVPAEVYAAMIALREQDAYKEGTAWTNNEPYSDSKGYYHWKGGPIDGVNISAVGCVAFAFILSDAAFGSLPARMYAEGEFAFEDIKVGDILRVNNDAHTVIVLEVSDAGVVVAEGNISTGDHKGKVHWGRAISKEDVMRSTSHYITRYPEGYIAPNDPTADESIGAGPFGGGLTWNLTKAGTMTISGSGAMPDFDSIEEQPWSSNSSKIRKVVIGEGVTSIGSCAFRNCGVLSAEIPSSVTAIGNSAFQGSSMISVTIPGSVSAIGDSAFQACQNLSSVTLSEGLERIGQNAFSACANLTSIVLPASIEEVGAAAFFQCQAMTSAAFAPGSKQVKLGDNLFTQCYYLMSVTLPGNIDRIGDGMFQNCLRLPGVEIPQGAQSIGGSAFASSGVSTVIIPDSVTTIGIAAFASCYSLKDIYFTGTEAQWNSISKIGDTEAAVSKVTMHYNYIPAVNPDPDDNHTGGGENSGNNTGGNTGGGGNAGGEENSGNNTGGNTGEGSNAGGGNNTAGGSGNGDYSGGNAGGGENSGSSTGGNTGGGSNAGGGDNTAGGSSGNGDYSGGNAGSSDSPVIEDNTESSDNSEGSDKSEGGESQKPEQEPLVKGETFTDSKNTYKVTKAGKEVELTTIKSTEAKVTVNTVTGTDGVVYKVTSIGAKAMQNNKKLTSLTIGTNVKTVEANAFSGCTKLTAVTLGKNVTEIGEGAFRGCKKLDKVTIKSTKLSFVGKQAFKGTKSSLKVKVPAGQLTKYKKILKKAGLKTTQVTK